MSTVDTRRDLFELSVLTALACGRVGGGGEAEPLHLAQEEAREALRPAIER